MPICGFSGVIAKKLRDDFKEAQRLGLGERNDRSPQKPTKLEDGTYEGGTAFERHDLALNVRNAPRCYTLAQSYQVQRNIVGPAAATKIAMGEEPSDHLRLRQKIIQVRLQPVALSGLRAQLLM